MYPAWLRSPSGAFLAVGLGGGDKERRDGARTQVISRGPACEQQLDDLRWCTPLTGEKIGVLRREALALSVFCLACCGMIVFFCFFFSNLVVVWCWKLLGQLFRPRTQGHKGP